MTLPRDDIWFARVPGRGKMVPIHPKGWRVVYRFLAGMFGSAALGIVFAFTGPVWLWPLVMAIGMAASGYCFITTAYRHTDHGKTTEDYRGGTSMGNT